MDRAIEIAMKTGVPLKIAAKVDKVDRNYFESEIRRLLHQPGIEFLGEIGENQKSEFLGNASALLFPIDWPEPFGLAMIEAMACGTPTLAFRCGSVPEVMTPLAGRVVETMDEAISAIEGVLTMDRCAVRRAFEARFTASRMAQDYISLYQSIATVRETSSRSATSLSHHQLQVEEHVLL